MASTIFSGMSCCVPRAEALFRRLPADSVFLSLTAHCNLRCAGCRYGRDFMRGSVFPRELLRPLLSDAAEFGYRKVRLYGGEPLLYPHLEEATATCAQYGLTPWLTTNGYLLREKIEGLYAAGLRRISFGYYGHAAAFDAYVGERGAYARLDEGIAFARDRFGDDLHLKVEFLLMQPTCSRQALDEALAFAERHAAPITINLVHYSLPYFKDAAGASLQFTEADRDALEDFSGYLLEAARRYPKLINRSVEGLASIPDWLIRREDMRVPCDRDSMLWVGPDASVQLCYVTFPLGSLRTHRLRELLHTRAHRGAVRACRRLQCPNCHCGFSTRIDKHGPSRRHYRRLVQRRYAPPAMQ